MIYLDSAATSFIKPQSVKDAVVRAMNVCSSPGRGAYAAAMRAADTVYECRETACRLFNFDKPENVVFTQNATHALNIAIGSLACRGTKVLISGYEHNSVTRPLNAADADITVADAKLFDSAAALRSFEEKLDNAELVICNHISNVFGFVQPIYDIAEKCRIKGVPLIVDASQSAGVEKLDAGRLSAAFIAMPGHKGLLGPQGTGLLLCGMLPKPLMSGGTGSDSIMQTMPTHLPDVSEAGTLNVSGIAGLNAGMKFVLNRGAEEIGAYEKKLCRIAANMLGSVGELEVFRGDDDVQSGVLSFRHKKIDCESFCDALGNHGIAARCGLHCAPLAHRTVGTEKTGTVRISFSPFVSRAQVIKACSIIEMTANIN